MPDQSLSNDAVSGKTGQEVGNPADTTANSPEAATPESQASNVNRASEGETQQADVTINQDPVIGSGDAQTSGAAQASGPADDYDDEEKYGYRDLQKLAKDRTGDGSGKREEIVARLREADAAGSGGDSSQNLGAATTDADISGQPPTPRGEVDPAQSPVGGSIGFGDSGRGQQHAEVLQGLSNDRRSQQLAAVKERSERTGGDEE